MRSYESRLLRGATALIDRFAGKTAVDRLYLLEAVAGLYAGWSVEEYWHSFNLKPGAIEGPQVRQVLDEIGASGIPVPLALAALSREEVEENTQKKTGAYYTDFRLAQLLAREGVRRVRTDGLWIDTACGSGMLLAAAALEVPEGERRDTTIRVNLAGSDLSSLALRGSRLVVASTTPNLEAVESFNRRLWNMDSLRSSERWKKYVGRGAALVIGNPPWERLRPSRHEVASTAGEKRHYGQSFQVDIDVSDERAALLRYVRDVTRETVLQGRGDHDLYKLFLELSLSIAADDGVISLLLPAGLVRSQGTAQLRSELNAVAPEMSIALLENRAQHFAIDTRFKFLALTARVGRGDAKPIELRVADRTGLLPENAVEIDRRQLEVLRPDLSLPEVRSDNEWALFARLSSESEPIGSPDGPWHPEYRREADMTLDRRHFTPEPEPGTLPLLEGRHVAQYRWRAKKYVSGEGRAAIWRPQPLGAAELRSQWFVDPSSLSRTTKQRAQKTRIGFCDITGQTNERSLLAARIPADVVCGNKVPTLEMLHADEQREDLLLALLNSISVDWMLRRVVTTTINFFILDALPLPRITEDDEIGSELIELCRRVSAAEGNQTLADLWRVGSLRARIDALVAFAWGITPSEMDLMLQDFPLLDRGQPSLGGEKRSTITADCIALELARLYDDVPRETEARVREARRLGAVPYIPAEFA